MFLIDYQTIMKFESPSIYKYENIFIIFFNIYLKIHCQNYQDTLSSDPFPKVIQGSIYGALFF
jgi:hypothetical protein